MTFFLTAAGAEKFASATGANVGKQLAIILDNRVQSAPRINERITDQGVIQGSFTAEEANDLALVLRAGALPAGLTYLEERTVGPSLGARLDPQGHHGLGRRALCSSSSRWSSTTGAPAGTPCSRCS